IGCLKGVLIPVSKTGVSPHYTWRGFFMAKKGQHFQHCTKEFKMKAVRMYEEGNKSYNMLSEELGLRSSTQKFGSGRLVFW
ncbi:transposase, partial [Bacillus subtilis]